MKEDQNALAEQRCIPCQGGTQPLSATEIYNFLQQLDQGWQVNGLGHLYKKYIFKNFVTSIKFLNLIADIAEREAHHPELLIGWGYCNIEMWTHKINGLTPSDFYMAAKIEQLFSENNSLS